MFGDRIAFDQLFFCVFDIFFSLNFCVFKLDLKIIFILIIGLISCRRLNKCLLNFIWLIYCFFLICLFLDLFPTFCILCILILGSEILWFCNILYLSILLFLNFLSFFLKSIMGWFWLKTFILQSQTLLFIQLILPLLRWFWACSCFSLILFQRNLTWFGRSCQGRCVDVKQINRTLNMVLQFVKLSIMKPFSLWIKAFLIIRQLIEINLRVFGLIWHSSSNSVRLLIRMNCTF